MSRSTLRSRACRLVVDKPFDAFTASIDQQLGQLQPGFTTSSNVATSRSARAMLKSMAGPSGFVLFRKEQSRPIPPELRVSRGRQCNISSATRSLPLR